MAGSVNILLVGFPPELLAKCREALESHGHQVFSEASTEGALAALETRRSDLARPSLIALGPMDPVPSMVAVRTARAHPLARAAAILVVNDKLHPDEGAAVLDAGADDCYSRPFLPAVFTARVRGLLRLGSARRKPGDDDPDLLRPVPAMTLHLIQRSVTVDGAPVSLSRGQFDLLAHLAKNKGSPVAMRELTSLMARHLLYVSAGRVRQELEQVRAKLGRLGSLLTLLPDGQARLQDPADPVPSSPQSSQQ